ncbi:MAG: hypothetical protein KGY80_14235 [Candidatus Thorarchaeota archaeon]|nr:hypothetical protein [Candidatus Thorarchaeota archaeon]
MSTNEKVDFMESLQSDPHFIYILISAAIWVIGAYVPLIGPILTAVGFAATCFTTAITALKRPTATAWPGVIVGVVLRIVASFIGWVPFLGLLAPLISIIGNVLILFFVVPLAIQQGEEILGETMKRLEGAKEEAIEEEAAAEEEETTTEGVAE